MSRAINIAAVLGAGTMGAAIAAHLANAGIPTFLLDIVPRELTPDEEKKGLTLDDPQVRNRIVRQGWERARKARPANLFSDAVADRVTLGNLQDNFDWVGDVDWIIEAVVERLDIKQQLMGRIEGMRRPDSIVSTNTSGIPIRQIAAGRSQSFKSHFLGTHFFNPPRYLHLLEIIPHAETSPDIVDFMTQFATRTLGKGVVVCNDTPNFIANRFISIVGGYTVNYALDHGYTVKEVDALTGPVIGRPKTATFRLLDLVGLDVMADVNENLYPAIPDDPYRDVLQHPQAAELMETMLERNWLGNKAQAGFYKQVKTEDGRAFWELNLETLEHGPPGDVYFASVSEYKEVEDADERIRLLAQADDRAGEFIWAIVAFELNYAASLVPEVADTIRDIDNAVRWGFQHELGPFEIWDALGVATTVERMEAKGISVTPWVKDMLDAGFTSFYRQKNGRLYYYAPGAGEYVLADTDPRRIRLQDIKADEGRILAYNDGATLLDLGDGVLCLEFHSKMNALDQEIIAMLGTALDELENDWAGLVVGNQGEHFCAGANVFMVAMAAMQEEWDQIDAMIRDLQNALMAFRYSLKPVVTAPFGMTLGGGAEVMMGSSAICAAAETYIGQVEARVGLVPAGGGCKEMLRRVVSPVVRENEYADPLPFLRYVFEKIALAEVSASAVEAREWGYLSPADRIVMNRHHLLHAAKQQVLAMVEADYRPAVRDDDKVWAVGANGLAALQVLIWGQREAGYASEHDALIAKKTANILCGGPLARPQWVDPQYILDLEREAFLSLLGEQNTLDRIWHFLNTGKPLRN
jgi:3-hydroxyacyl-CoA dehydrogenase